MPDEKKDSLESILESVDPNRRSFLQKLLAGGALAMGLPASTLVAQIVPGQGAGKVAERNQGGGKKTGKNPENTNSSQGKTKGGGSGKLSETTGNSQGKGKNAGTGKLSETTGNSQGKEKNGSAGNGKGG